jgi:hypothetical protein
MDVGLNAMMFPKAILKVVTFRVKKKIFYEMLGEIFECYRFKVANLNCLMRTDYTIFLVYYLVEDMTI